MSTLASMVVRLGIDTDRLQAGADRAKKTLSGLGKAVGALGVGVPAAAAGVAAVGGMAAAFASAGVAAKAFQLAAQPQLESVANVADLAAKAEEAAAEGGEKAAAAQKEYTDALNELPPATRATAKEFVGLKGDFQKWSDSLSSTTMPVFTKGLQILRGLLPALTPLVKAAAAAISNFLDDIQKSVDSGSVANWAKDLAQTAGKNLGTFLRSMKNVVVGFAGIISAFTGVSDNASGGIEVMTERFAAFGQGLKGSEGFAQFIDLAKQGAKLFGTLAQAGLQLFLAIAPLIGVTSQLALWLAEIINAMPPGVLTAIAVAVTAISVAMKAWALYGAIVSGVTRAWAVAQMILNAAFWTSPITWIVAGIVALVAIIVLIATKTTWFQQLWSIVWGFIKDVTAGAVDAIKSIIGWFANLPGLISGWFGQAKDWVVAKWNALVDWLKGFPGKVIGAIAGLGGMLWSTATSAGGRLVSAIRGKLTDAVNWVKGLPGRAKAALGDLGSKLWNSGASLIKGFIGGIKSMAGRVADAVGGVLSKARNLLPFSPAKEGPFSGKGWTLYSGRSLIEGFATGVAQRQNALRKQMLATAQTAADTLPTPATPRGVTQAASGREPQHVAIDVTGGSDDLIRLIRKWLQINGHGANVQGGLGTR
ncbi:phage tail protein [Streptomyces hygroscopicus]|uniref:phage tail protein n=1 Tax=Streptomyces hygroscopicus TaxID=1912 RepID=UPI0033F79640